MDIQHPIALGIEQACRVTGLGRSTLYRLIGEGRLQTVKIGSRRLVLVESLRALLHADAVSAPVRDGEAR